MELLSYREYVSQQALYLQRTLDPINVGIIKHNIISYLQYLEIVDYRYEVYISVFKWWYSFFDHKRKNEYEISEKDAILEFDSKVMSMFMCRYTYKKEDFIYHGARK